LYGSLATLFPSYGTDVFKLYVERQLQDCGNPSDPVERMLVEEMLLAHHTVGGCAYEQTWRIPSKRPRRVATLPPGS
jgi:hypothetical protein